MRKITFTDIYRLRTIKKNSMLYIGNPKDGGAVFMSADMSTSKKMAYVIDMEGLLYSKENYTRMKQDNTSPFSMSKAEILAVMENYAVSSRETILYEALLDGMAEPIDFEVFLGSLQLLDKNLSERTEAFWNICREVNKRVYIHNKKNIMLTELGGISGRYGELMLLQVLSAAPRDVEIYIVGLNRLRSGILDVLLEMRRNGTGVHCFAYKLDICTRQQFTEILGAFPELILHDICGPEIKVCSAVYIRDGKLWEVENKSEKKDLQNGMKSGSSIFPDVNVLFSDEVMPSQGNIKQNIRKNRSRTYEDIKKD